MVPDQSGCIVWLKGRVGATLSSARCDRKGLFRNARARATFRLSVVADPRVITVWHRPSSPKGSESRALL
jgi:hypothetical protein